MNWCMNWCMAIIIWVIGGFLEAPFLFVGKSERLHGYVPVTPISASSSLVANLAMFVQQVSSDQNPGWLGYIGDEILPRYIGIIINQ